LIECGYAKLNEMVSSSEHAVRLRFSHQPNPMMSIAVSMVPIISLAAAGGPLTWVGIDYDDAEDVRFVHYYVPRFTNDGQYGLSRGQRLVPERSGLLLAARRSDELSIEGKLSERIGESALFVRKLLQQFGAVTQSRSATRGMAEELLAKYAALLQRHDRLTDAAGAFTAHLWSLVVDDTPTYLSGLTVNSTYLDCQKAFAITVARMGLLAHDRFFWLVCGGCAARLSTTVALMGRELELAATCRRCDREYRGIYGADNDLIVVPRVILDDAFDVYCRRALGLGISYPKAVIHLKRADELARQVALAEGVQVPGHVWLADYEELTHGVSLLCGLPTEADALVTALARAPLLELLCVMDPDYLRERFALIRPLMNQPHPLTAEWAAESNDLGHER
jgi:hypothetical protein